MFVPFVFLPGPKGDLGAPGGNGLPGDPGGVGLPGGRTQLIRSSSKHPEG